MRLTFSGYKLSKRVLIVRTDRIGDVIMITPVIRELRKTFPDSFISTEIENGISIEDVLKNINF
jgi:3-deoxy-D-manno-octulosonic-acid transferase